jgi:uncharacterized protein YjbJ (UPF0337 family)
MNASIVKGMLNIAKGKLKQTLARLIHDEAQFLEGKTDELVGRIQWRAGAARKNYRSGSNFMDETGFGHR